MSDDPLRRQLQRIDGDDPSDEFVERLRRRLGEGAATTDDGRPDDVNITLLDVGDRQPPEGRGLGATWPLTAAAAVLLGVVLLGRVLGPSGPSETAAASEATEIGTAWLQAIVENDRDAFVALHANGLETNDTLMGYSQDVDLLTPARIGELYFDGFDAFQVSLAIDGDLVRAEGCEDLAEERVRCGYTATLLGPDSPTYTVFAELTVVDRLVTELAFTEISTDPADLRSEIERFLDEAATDEDRACLLLGFNTVGCGEHDSDFLQRYLDFRDEQQASTED